jgi:D-amino-acid dehydrogenase
MYTRCIHHSAASDVVVIGGGAIGVCCACDLARSGRTVTLLERDRIGAGSSWGNAGLIPTSVCSPLAAPGVVGATLRMLGRRDAPFRLRPRLDPGLARWLRLFVRSCDHEQWQRSTTVARDMIRASRRILESVDNDFAYAASGLVALYRSPAALERAVHDSDALTELGIRARPIDRREVELQVPDVRSDVAGGIFFPEDAHLDPARFVTAMAQRAEASGVEIVTGKRVRALGASRGRVVRVELGDLALEPEQVVLAAGAWTPELGRWLEPGSLQPAKGYSITWPTPGSNEIPLRLGEDKLIVTPVSGGVRVTGKLDLVGRKLTIDRRRIDDLPRHAARYLELPGSIGADLRWAGLRPLTPDGLPIIGRHPSVGNVILATGHGMLGIGLASITGRLVAGIANDEPAVFDLAPLRPERFAA